MVTQAPRWTATTVAVLFSLSCIGLMIFVWVTFGGSVPLAPQGYRVQAVFNETGLLVPNADVRIAGVNVGKVVSVQSQGTQSLVALDIDDRYAPIPASTRAILREKTLLGEAYVELSTGNRHGAKLRDGGTIPSSHVASTQQLDQVLNSFTKPVQQNFQAFLEGTGAALKGQGQNLNDAFGNLDSTAGELNQVADVLNRQGGDLQTMIRDSGTVLTAVGARGAALQSLISQGDRVFAATASENRNLTTTVNALPAFLTQLRATLVRLNATLGIAKPSLDALEPVTPLLRPALADLTSLSGPLVALLRQAPGTLRLANRTLPMLTTFVRDNIPLVNALLPAAQQIVPVINVVADYRRNILLGMADLAAILQAKAPANTTSDALGVPTGMADYVRQVLTLGPDSLFGQSSRSPAIRTNTYFAPGALDSVGTSGESAASCAGAGSGNVPCRLQPSFSWGHGIGTSYYPHVTAQR